MDKKEISCKGEAAIVINDETGKDVFRLSNEDLKDLMELSKELQQQENHYQAFPYYWSPASEKLETNIHGEGEVIEVLYEGSVTCTPEELAESGFDDHDYERGHVCDYAKFIAGNDLVFEGKYLKSLERDWVEYIENEIDDAEIWTSDYRENVENNPSFFLSDIKDYIKHNKHHLGRNPHTYAQTIFRMPKMEKLMKILYRLNPQPEGSCNHEAFRAVNRY